MSDDFWEEDEVTAQPPAPRDRVHRHRPKPERFLTRDEMIIPDVYGGVLGEWRRDQAYMFYRMLKGGPYRLPRPLLVVTGVVTAICLIGAAAVAFLGPR